METPYRFAPADALAECTETMTDEVIGAGIRVHRYFGPGHFERIYRDALTIELKRDGFEVQTEVPVEVEWRGHLLGIGYRADIVVNGCLLLELKCVQTLLPVHEAQLIGYLRLMRIKTGLLMNFQSTLLKTGIWRRSIE